MNSKYNIIDNLKEFINIPSFIQENQENTPFGVDISKALHYILNLGSDMGFSTRNIDNHVGIIEYGSGKNAIALLVHCDVVPAGQGWDSDPFQLVERDNKLYGRGSIDDKGPALACLYALKNIMDKNITGEHKVQMIIGTDEETLWRGINKFTEKEPLPIAGFTPDGNFPLIHGEKGILDFDVKYELNNTHTKEASTLIKIKGGISRNSVPDTCTIDFKFTTPKATIIDKIDQYFSENDLNYKLKLENNIATLKVLGKSSHAMHPQNGLNSIAHAILAYGDLYPNDDFYKSFDDILGLDYLGHKIGCNTNDEISGDLTLNVGTVSITDNIISMNLNIRYPVTSLDSNIINILTNRFKQSEFTLSIVDNLNPLYVPLDSPIIKELMDVYRSHTKDTESQPIVIGGGTYARVLPNTVSFGPVLPWQDELAHEANEFIEVDHLHKLIEIYEDAIIRLMNIEL